MSEFTAEKSFLNRKLPTQKVEWGILPALSQIASPPMAEPDARGIIKQLKDALGQKSGTEFHQMVFTAISKLRGGLRIIISVPLLRKYFSSEIEGDISGGGRGLNPLSTRPSPRGGR